MKAQDRYPYSLKTALQEKTLDNILDSNMFSAYIARELDVPVLSDPRRPQTASTGMERFPGYVYFPRINQIFSYIGYVKRQDHEGYRQYLPQLFQELNLFIRVMEEIVYNLNIFIPVEIYDELKRGTSNFFESYRQHPVHQVDWIGKIWKNQKTYIERVDTLIDTLKTRDRVFDYSGDPLYETVVTFCKGQNGTGNLSVSDDVDIRFIASSSAKAARDKKPNILWSGDQHILRIIKSLYDAPDITSRFPQLYLYSSYEPLDHKRWFP